MKLIIEKVSNGVILYYIDDTEPESNYTEVFTFSEDDNHVQGIIDLLWSIYEELIPSRSRYDKELIEIRKVHGDKYECKNNKKCPICKDFALALKPILKKG